MGMDGTIARHIRKLSEKEKLNFMTDTTPPPRFKSYAGMPR